MVKNRNLALAFICYEKACKTQTYDPRRVRLLWQWFREASTSLSHSLLNFTPSKNPSSLRSANTSLNNYLLNFAPLKILSTLRSAGTPLSHSLLNFTSSRNPNTLHSANTSLNNCLLIKEN